MTTDNEQLLTREEAVSFINRKHKAPTLYYIQVRNAAPVLNEPDKVFPMGLSCTVLISRDTAIRAVRDMLSPGLEERGARLPVTVREWECLGKARLSIYIG